MTIGAFTVARRTVWLVAALAVALAGVLMILIRPADSASDVPAEISCDRSTAEFGSLISCSATGPEGSILDWGDGAQVLVGDGVTATHAPVAVGPVSITTSDQEGTVLAATVVDIAPDLDFSCQHGLPKPVYALAVAPEGAYAPYVYVFLHPDTGQELRPGDADYPQSVMEMSKLEQVQLGEEPVVGLCTAESAAVDSLGGSITWTFDDGWHPARSVTARKVTPASPGNWEGVQPLDVEVVAEAAGYEASERIGVYFGGCG